MRPRSPWPCRRRSKRRPPRAATIVATRPTRVTDPNGASATTAASGTIGTIAVSGTIATIGVIVRARRARSGKVPRTPASPTVGAVPPGRKAVARPQFDKLTPLFPDERFRLESGPLAITERIIDMIVPIGKGQRGMVVSPPKAGKTTILKQIANGIIHSNPETHVIVLLVDERPEEVTDWQRTVRAAEGVYSAFDKPTDQHIQVTELVLERAKRLAEMGQHVAISLDSLTRLTRAYNLGMPASGKILTGGIDSAALYPPRRFFGAARNIEEGG